MTSRLRSSVALRFSLLASLGLVAVACGGSSTSSGKNPDPEAGGSSGAGGGGTGGGGTKPTTTMGKCTAPTTDPVTGLTKCKEGYTHRAKAQRCEPSGVVSDRVAPSNPGSCPGIDLDCTTIPNGFCSYGGQAPICKTGCYEDSDCPSSSVCACGNTASPTGGECVPSDCATDDDCEDGLCAASQLVCGDLTFACQIKNDECQTNADCANGGVCISDFHSAQRTCFQGACGRPFLVLAEQRLPPVTGRGDWQQLATPNLTGLSAAQRAEAAEHWTKLGQMEHASIAAFARFSLQLLALGAPAELVELCNAALADETMHAKLCFGLGSAYAGRALGPGPLDVSRSLEVTSLADIVDLVIAEGCVGETSAALEALDAAHVATDPVIRAAYQRIAEDEQRHAELAFRFVRWALQHDYDAVAARIAAALETPLRERDVVAPCLEALLQTRAAA